jgi:hypothetical protein
MQKKKFIFILKQKQESTSHDGRCKTRRKQNNKGMSLSACTGTYYQRPGT